MSPAFEQHRVKRRDLCTKGRMKLSGPLLVLSVLAGAYGAVLNPRHRRHQDEDIFRINYRIWGEYPWDRPGNPPPIFPPDDFLRYSQIGRWWNQERPWENTPKVWRDALLAESKEDDADEYHSWGKFPWELPGNPPPFSPPADMTTLSQIGRWWNQDDNEGRPEKTLSQLLSENKDDASDEYRLWGKFPWERPANPPPFVPPPDTAAFSQIGRWWNQEEIGQRPTKLSRYLDELHKDEKLNQNPAQEVDERRSKLVPLFPSQDQKRTRTSRSVWQNKPWEKPWNPPPFLPSQNPPLE